MSLINFVQRRARPIALSSSFAIVAVWTMIRHISNGINFDVVGQVGLVEQWTHGLTGGAQVGPTNYILKMPFYLVINALHFLSPNNRLLILALLFNLLTFWLLLVLFEKILNLYNLKGRSWLYLGMVWLATISGSVFWVDYANSRNLETVGGILFLYLTLRFLKRPCYKAAGLLAAVGSVVFFADSLQVFVMGAPIVLYVAGRWLLQRSKPNFVTAAGVVIATAGAFVASKLLFWLSTVLLPVSYLALPAPIPKLTVHNAAASLKAIFVSTFKVFDGDFVKKPYGPNSIRELLNAIILLAIIYLVIRLLLQRRRASYPRALLLTIIAVNYVVYVASGQALQLETERYLIMVPLITVLLVAAWGGSAKPKYKPQIQLAWVACLAISTCLIFGALAVSWSTRYSKDAPRTAAISFMRQHHFRYAVSSREIGIPATYYADQNPTILPAQCSANHRLQISTLFYDQAAFGALKTYHGDVPIILQNNDIKYGNFHCDSSDIVSQFGIPKYQLAVPGVGVAEVYSAQSINGKIQ